MNIDLDVDALILPTGVGLGLGTAFLDLARYTTPSQEGNTVRFMSSALAIWILDLRLHIDMEFEAVQSNTM